MNNKIKFGLGTGLFMVVVLILSRLMPHPPNFTPLAAVGLFGAAWFSHRTMSFIIPLAALWLSNLVLDNAVYARLYPEYYEGFSLLGSTHSWFTYAAFVLVIAMGFGLLRRLSAGRLLGASLLASLIFFAVSNFGVWLLDPLYTKDSLGLATAYIAGLPFLLNTALGDLFYVGLLFGIFEWVRRRVPALQEAVGR